MQLPTPLEMSALGTTLLVGAGLVFWFLKSIRGAFYLALGGVLLLTSAGVAYGYERMGEDKIKPQLLACQDDLGTVKQANIDLQGSLTELRTKVAKSNTTIQSLTDATNKAKAQTAALIASSAKMQETLTTQISSLQAVIDAGPKLPKTPDEIAKMLASVDEILSDLLR